MASLKDGIDTLTVENEKELSKVSAPKENKPAPKLTPAEEGEKAKPTQAQQLTEFVKDKIFTKENAEKIRNSKEDRTGGMTREEHRADIMKHGNWKPEAVEAYLDGIYGKEQKQAYTPFKLDTKKYKDVKTTPYGFIYNIGGSSITDVAEQERAFGNKIDPNKKYGFLRTTDSGDEVFHETFEDAYNAAKNSGQPQPRIVETPTKNEIDTKHGDVENAPFIVDADGEKFGFDTEREADSFIERNKYSYSNLKKQRKPLTTEELNRRTNRSAEMGYLVEEARAKGQTPQQVLDSVAYDMDIEPNSEEYKELRDTYVLRDSHLNKETGQYEYDKYTLGSNKQLSGNERAKMEQLVNDLKKAGLKNVQLTDGYEDFGAEMKWTAPTSGDTWVLNPRQWLDYMNGKITSADIINELKNGKYKDLWKWEQTQAHYPTVTKRYGHEWTEDSKGNVTQVKTKNGNVLKIGDRPLNKDSKYSITGFDPETETVYTSNDGSDQKFGSRLRDIEKDFADVSHGTGKKAEDIFNNLNLSKKGYTTAEIEYIEQALDEGISPEEIINYYDFESWLRGKR